MRISSKLKFFFRFLKEQGAFNEYIRKIKEEDIPFERLEYTVNKRMLNMISGLFLWYYTDKVDWPQLDREWRDLLYEINSQEMLLPPPF